MSGGKNWQALYEQEHGRICELSSLICALEVIADDLGGTPIEDSELALRRNAICGIARALARAVDMPDSGLVD